MTTEELQPTPAEGAARIIVFGDIHGDLDTFALSLADHGLFRYEGNLEELLQEVRDCLESPFSERLEAKVVRQPTPVVLVLVGDLLDRYPHGYHVIQLVMHVRWEKFGIRLHPLLGNHDLMNLMFFTNPYEVHRLMEGGGRQKEEVMLYIGSMGLAESLRSFYDLHRAELLETQLRFYRQGRLEIPLDSYGLTLRYPCKLSWLSKRHILREGARARGGGEDPQLLPEDMGTYLEELRSALGDESKAAGADSLRSANLLVQHVFDSLGEAVGRHGERNWWRIYWREQDRWFGYSPEVNGFNAFFKEVTAKGHQLVPIDWRLISFVWRRQYGDYFRRARLMHLEGDTLFVHGGLSPLAMLDPLFFGNLYNPSEGKFRNLSEMTRVTLGTFVDRANRLGLQVLENTLNDFSFRRLSGAEIYDQIGRWRGGSEGLPEFGGPLWADFEFLRMHVEDPAQERLQGLYRDFVKATGIKRIFCGHTAFVSQSDPDIRAQRMSAMEPLGLQILCVDNGCSRAYRWYRPVVTGLEVASPAPTSIPGLSSPPLEASEFLATMEPISPSSPEALAEEQESGEEGDTIEIIVATDEIDSSLEMVKEGWPISEGGSSP